VWVYRYRTGALDYTQISDWDDNEKSDLSGGGSTFAQRGEKKLSDALMSYKGLPRTVQGCPNPIIDGEFLDVVDDGQGRLTADEYIECRTKFKLVQMQKSLQTTDWLTTWLLIMIYVFTAVSVTLGTLHYVSLARRCPLYCNVSSRELCSH